LFGLIRRLERGELRRFIKLEAEYKHFLNYSRSTLGFRMYGGYGYVYGRTGDNPEYTLPFFKAFSAGGPYSMRAWQVRQLGPGTSPIYDTTGGRSTDRFGNVQLEGNIEYRFNLATIAGIKIGSAFFTDIGNIWSKEFDSAGNNIPEAEFRLNKLYRDLAVAGGTGLRLDFDFFLIRLDWAYKLKDPLYADRQNGWFQQLDLGSGQFQLGIGYSF
jgi:outer membrane protein assembly factor BamA